MDALAAIRSRRSTGRLVEPGPTERDLATILEAAASAPDHDELRPWRFIVLAGDDKGAFGEVLADAYDARCEAEGVEALDAKREKERTKLGRAPTVLIVAAVRRDTSKVPWEEQQASASAAAENALLAATALGYGSMWRTGEPCYDEGVKRALGLGPDDGISGFLYLGTLRDGTDLDPHSPDLTGLVEHWRATGWRPTG